MRQPAAPAAALLLPAVLALLGGCAPTLPVVVQAVRCPDPGQAVAQRCSAPQTVPDGASFGDVLALHQADRKALRDCAAQQTLLLQLVADCQRALQDYNDRLVEVNKRIAAKP